MDVVSGLWISVIVLSCTCLVGCYGWLLYWKAFGMLVDWKQSGEEWAEASKKYQEEIDELKSTTAKEVEFTRARASEDKCELEGKLEKEVARRKHVDELHGRQAEIITGMQRELRQRSDQILELRKLKDETFQEAQLWQKDAEEAESRLRKSEERREKAEEMAAEESQNANKYLLSWQGSEQSNVLLKRRCEELQDTIQKMEAVLEDTEHRLRTSELRGANMLMGLATEAHDVLTQMGKSLEELDVGNGEPDLYTVISIMGRKHYWDEHAGFFRRVPEDENGGRCDSPEQLNPRTVEEDLQSCQEEGIEVDLEKTDRVGGEDLSKLESIE